MARQLVGNSGPDARGACRVAQRRAVAVAVAGFRFGDAVAAGPSHTRDPAGKPYAAPPPRCARVNSRRRVATASFLAPLEKGRSGIGMESWKHSFDFASRL